MGEEQGPASPRRGITRRQLLQGGAAVAATAYVGGRGGEAASPMRLAAAAGPGGIIATLIDPSKTFTLEARRRLDLVYLSFDFYNLQIDTTDPAKPTLGKQNTRLDSWIVVRFPPQHLTEVAIGEDAHSDPSPSDAFALHPQPVETRLAGESRLAFTIPSTLLPLPYDLDHLLDWDAWQPRMVQAAGGPRPGGLLAPLSPFLVAPAPGQTAIELPWFLVLSPSPSQRWRHHGRTPPGPIQQQFPLATEPVTLNGRTDLWQTNLVGTPIPDVNGLAPPTVRAVWDFDADYAPGSSSEPPDTAYPFPQALSRRDWHDIVWNTSVARSGFTPSPVQVKRLSLSALGGSLDGKGTWPANSANSLKEWEQRTFLGRDAYVKVVRSGYLYPFGIPAVRVKITERKLLNKQAPGTRPIAYLRQRQFLVVSQKAIAFDGGTGQTAKGPRQVPFTTLRSKTRVTPNLDLDASDSPVSALHGSFAAGDAFMPVVLGNTYRFHLIGTDFAGNDVDFVSPAVFVDSNVATDPSSAVVGHVVDAYKALDPRDDRRAGDFAGRKVAMADPGATRDSTAHEVKTITWSSHGLNGSFTQDQLVAADQPRWWLEMAQARLRLTPAEQVSGRSLGGVDVAFHRQYVDAGLGASNGNKGDLFLSTLSPPTLKFNGQSCGAVALPDVGIIALSRRIGPVGGSPTDAAAADQADQTALDGNFDAEQFFKDTDAKILGAVELWRIVDDGNGTADLAVAPTISSRQSGQVVTTNLHFEPVPQADRTGFAGDGSASFFVPDDGATMVIDATVETHLADPASSVTTVDGAVTDFTMYLLGDQAYKFVGLHFSRLAFHSETGQSGTVDPHIDQTTFFGPLEFIQDLQNYLNLGGGGPAVEVTPTQITADLSISIPTIALGVFSLENLSFSAGLVVPFLGGSTTVSFGFCSQDNPFHLTISFFGGGGWFGLTLDMHGIHSFEVGLEFGASAGIDLGVASGEVHIWAGIYFKMETLDDAGNEHVTLQGYVRAGGSVEVLCIASVSLEAYIGFLYDDNGGVTKVGGEATLTLTVSVLFFSISVEASWQQYFGGDGDPTFADFFPPDQVDNDPDVALPPADPGWTSEIWRSYCTAFAGDTVVVQG